MSTKGKSTIWNERTLEVLRRMYPMNTDGDVADVIGCSDQSVRNKAHELGLRKDPSYDSDQFRCRYVNKGKHKKA